MSETLLSYIITQSPEDDSYQEDKELAYAKRRLMVACAVILGIVIFIGLVFNTVAFVVFLRSPVLRRTTTARYLIALTIADSTCLIGELLRWLNTIVPVTGPLFNLDFTETKIGWCCIMFFLRYYGQFVSVWLTVAITVERYIGIAMPLRASTISTKTVTTLVIIAIYTIGVAMTAFPFWDMEIVETDMHGVYCTYKDREVYNIWNWVSIRVGSLLLPCTLILLFTVMIIHNLRQMATNRQQMTANTSGNSVENQLTLMLILVAITTLVLRLPYTIAYPLYNYRSTIWGNDFFRTWPEFKLHIIKDVTYVIAIMNYMVNFFIFCLTGSTFRKSLTKCLQCKSMKPRPRRGHYTKATLGTSLASNSNSNISLQRVNHSGVSPGPTPKSTPKQTHHTLMSN